MRSYLKKRLPTNYEEQTYASPYWFIRIPHQMRFRTTVNAVLKNSPESLLDYGAGDGRLIFDLIEAGSTTKRFVAYEPFEQYRIEIEQSARLRGLSERIEVVSERESLTGNRFDFITCLGVLEHMPLSEREAFFGVCDSLLTESGEIFIDVPVEIGPTLLVKSLARVLLKGREPEYNSKELLRIGIGGRVFDPTRFDKSNSATWIHHHKGFDYRSLREEIRRQFEIVEENRTPLRFLPAPLGNQEIYFHARRR